MAIEWSELNSSSSKRELPPLLLDRLGQKYLDPHLQSVNVSKRYSRYDPRFLASTGRKLLQVAFNYFANEWPTSPNYQITENVDSFILAAHLKASGAISAANTSHLSDGYTTIPYLDAMALSTLPPKEVINMEKKGFGLWPIPKELSFGDLDWDTLRIEPYDPTKLQFLETLRLMPDPENAGFWMKDRKLGRISSKLTDMPIPSLEELLWIAQLYKKQQNEGLDSGGNFIQTSTGAEVSVSEGIFALQGPDQFWELMVQACIDRSEIPDFIHDYRARTGQIRAIKDRLSLYKDDQDFHISLYTGTGNVVVFHERVDHVTVALNNAQMVKLERTNGVKFIRFFKQVPFSDQLLHSTNLGALELEIKSEMDRLQKEFSTPQIIPLAVRFDQNEGVDIGFDVSDLQARTIFPIYDNNLSINVFRSLAPQISSQLAHFPLVGDSVLPNVVPDKNADEYFSSI